MFYACKLFPGRHDASVVLPHMLEGSYNYFVKASQSAADILKQNIMIAGLRKGFNAYAAAMNDPAGVKSHYHGTIASQNAFIPSGQ
ncbi:hypothetical protein [Arsenophonus endosymbiont of Aleurodicus floccissimus]|uniref:hypothetical protein n=1 Tax=Arsenophonus endosymbiont of Aleurodicus floccissimus TaxID=2152761 RepID=UPI001603A4DA|nr:hypothetical protein [Arsenophonus endosymbiont of Aleurodicus floccissimus]